MKISFYDLDDFNEATTKEGGLAKAIENVVIWHRSSKDVDIAKTADKYAARENTTIKRFVNVYYSIAGVPVQDTLKPNHQLACNYFDYLNSQRCNYSLGTGISFDKPETMDVLGNNFADVISQVGYYALIHGVCFIYRGRETCREFLWTEFCPIMNYATGEIVKGVRYWQKDAESPLYVEFYEEDGMSTYVKTKEDTFLQIKEGGEKRAYFQTVQETEFNGETTVVDEYNWSRLPIFPVYGSKHHCSTLPGMRSEIDAYDLGMSGFVNNMTDAQNILTIISGYDGMNKADLIQLKDWMRTQGIVQADEGKIDVKQIDHDVNGRVEFLKQLETYIYAQFGGLDVHTVMAGQTNDHISAAYEPLNAQADDFEDQITKGIRPLLAMLGIDDAPIFNRKAIANETETIRSILDEYQAGLLDKQTALRKLPNIDNDEIEGILAELEGQEQARFDLMMAQQALAEQSETEQNGDEGNEGDDE